MGPARVLRIRPVPSLRAIATRGYPWIEIDFPEDYTRAVNHVLPAIEDLALTRMRRVS